MKTILEIKQRLDGSQEEFTCLPCLVRPGRHAAVLYRLERDWHIPAARLTVPAGSLSTGFFWEAKPFNLYHWMTAEGESIGDYFNLAAETHVSYDRIDWLDLVVDYCLVPGRTGVFLDLDELPGQLDPRRLAQIEHARRELSALSTRLSRRLEQLSRRILAVSKAG